MADDDEQLRVRVAWLYFMEGLTQADIAAKLGITRLRANRLLGEARESGLVSIQVKARLGSIWLYQQIGDFGVVYRRCDGCKHRRVRVWMAG